MTGPAREDRGWSCPCGARLRSLDDHNGWGWFKCGHGHRWWHRYGQWELRPSIHDEPDPVLEESDRQDEWSEEERRLVWDQ